MIRFHQLLVATLLSCTWSAVAFAKSAQPFGAQEQEVVRAFESEMQLFSQLRQLGFDGEAEQHYDVALQIVFAALAQDPDLKLRKDLLHSKARPEFDKYWRERQAPDHAYNFLRLVQSAIGLGSDVALIRKAWEDRQREFDVRELSLEIAEKQLIDELVADRLQLVEAEVRRNLEAEKEYARNKDFDQLVKEEFLAKLPVYRGQYQNYTGKNPYGIPDAAEINGKRVAEKVVTAKFSRSQRLMGDERFFNNELKTRQQAASAELRRNFDALRTTEVFQDINTDAVARVVFDPIVKDASSGAAATDGEGAGSPAAGPALAEEDGEGVGSPAAGPAPTDDGEGAGSPAAGSAPAATGLVPVEPSRSPDFSDTRSRLQRQFDLRSATVESVAKDRQWRGYLAGVGLAGLVGFSQICSVENHSAVGNLAWALRLGLVFLPLLDVSSQASIAFSIVFAIPGVGMLLRNLVMWAAPLADLDQSLSTLNNLYLWQFSNMVGLEGTLKFPSPMELIEAGVQVDLSSLLGGTED